MISLSLPDCLSVDTHFFLAIPTPNPAHVVTKTLQMATAMGSPCAGVSSMLIVILEGMLRVCDWEKRVAGVQVCKVSACAKCAETKCEVEVQRCIDGAP